MYFCLGSDFDIREFHDRALDAGVGALEVMESVIHDWVQEVKFENGTSYIS